ncbi:unnamed protein product [Fusarium graminearum]|uniref:Chromosome 1, complete genome n=1 Tax=Gibberella zeae (strain ATCC MYA-4620 / CBS 123657 / FGSC 9075 / NRRL 31084 / PH-1) TaxID=229533 RepID=A0A098DBI9_GIBZE|nr:unnamed protein product [Fusarium graminearum]CZS79093.1 unnamed protein product [Fusarium graminearum]
MTTTSDTIATIKIQSGLYVRSCINTGHGVGALRSVSPLSATICKSPHKLWAFLHADTTG